jgi:hypothetical protein
LWRHRRLPIAPIVIGIVIGIGVRIVRIIPPVGVVPPIIPPVRIAPPPISKSPVIAVVVPMTESPTRVSAASSVASATSSGTSSVAATTAKHFSWLR